MNPVAGGIARHWEYCLVLSAKNNRKQESCQYVAKFDQPQPQPVQPLADQRQVGRAINFDCLVEPDRLRQRIQRPGIGHGG